MNAPIPRDRSVLFVVPCKGWSERLERKNVLPIFAKPMFVYSLEAISKSKYYTTMNAWVRTESEEVEKLLKTWGHASAITPLEVRENQTGVVDTVIELIESTVWDVPVDVMCIVYPNCPARALDTIDRAIDMCFSGRNSVRTYNSRGEETGNVWAFVFNPDDFIERWTTYTGAVIDDAIEVHTEEDLEKVTDVLRERTMREIAEIR